ncbi:hypothetical protein NDU88_011229 [Pleurodeles waltl]|uniref:Uncharacterized protein n=1 Tax=Pleurodeles waltl TaxID=8319 RepID=A0AAV7R2S8_PLEWA|nr:hypothetical protein NDU88_011229 [Pleurodeles waltl]
MEVPLADARVQEALRLLREAGRLDLIQGDLGAPSRPPRRASGGVAAAVLACSEPRGAASLQLVSGRGGGRLRARGEGRRTGARSFGDRRVVARDSPKRRNATGRVHLSGEGAPAAASIGRLGLVENGCTIKGTVVVVIVAEEQVQRGLGQIRNVTTEKGDRADNILAEKGSEEQDK